MKKEFDKEKWKEEKKIERRKTYEMLDRATAICQQHSDDLDAFLQITARFEHLSVSNALLIYMQWPNATQLHTYQQWKNQGYSLLRNQTPICLIERGRPINKDNKQEGHFWDVKHYFDISQLKQGIVPVKAREDFSELSQKFLEKCPWEMEVSFDTDRVESAWFDEQASVIYVTGKGSRENQLADLAVAIGEALLSRQEKPVEHREFLSECIGRILCYREGLPFPKRDIPIPESFAQKEVSQARQSFRFVKDMVYALDGLKIPTKQREEPQVVGL